MPNLSKNSNFTKFIFTILAIWFVLVFVLGMNGAFARGPEKIPTAMLLALIVPLIVFLTLFFTWNKFKAFILNLDLRFLTAMHAWRFVGLCFLILYVHGMVPGLFAWPAGLGDIAIALTAPWMVLSLVRQPAFAKSSLFLTWNLLGILDFIVAFITGTLSSGLMPEIASQITTAPLSKLPIILIPAYFVPLLFMAHLTAIFQTRLFTGYEK